MNTTEVKAVTNVYADIGPHRIRAVKNDVFSVPSETVAQLVESGVVQLLEVDDAVSEDAADRREVHAVEKEGVVEQVGEGVVRSSVVASRVEEDEAEEEVVPPPKRRGRPPKKKT